MTATLILKSLFTLGLVGANLIWVFIVIGAAAWNAKGEWERTYTFAMLIPTAVNVLILWSMWE